MNTIIIDEDGVLVTNKGAYPMPDPTTGHVFLPKQPYRIRVSKFVETQPSLEYEKQLKKLEDKQPLKR